MNRHPDARAAVLTTGGTIASIRDEATGAVRAAASPEELLATVPDLDAIATVGARALAAVNSWNITPQMMLDIVREVAREIEGGADGVVVTHGTDTLEETAMLAHMALPHAAPVVFVAAMRNLSEAGPDGPRNLRDAIRVAVDPESRGRDAMVIIAETIHPARYVTKGHTVNPGAFVTPHGGPIGEVTTVGVEFLTPSAPRETINIEHMDANVPVIRCWTGMDGAIFDWLASTGIDGLVVEGSGAGNVPGSVVPALARLVERGLPVLLTSRCLGGPLAPVYGTGGASGGGLDLVDAGLMLASRYTAQKARIALMALLGAGKDDAAIRSWFSRS